MFYLKVLQGFGLQSNDDEFNAEQDYIKELEQQKFNDVNGGMQFLTFLVFFCAGTDVVVLLMHFIDVSVLQEVTEIQCSTQEYQHDQCPQKTFVKRCQEFAVLTVKRHCKYNKRSSYNHVEDLKSWRQLYPVPIRKRV